VRSGDSLWSLAHRFNMDLSDLKRINGLKSKDPIRPGQKLIVASRHSHRRSLKRSSAASGHYIVQKGDTLWDVARHFNMDLAELKQVNGLKSKDPIRPGQTLIVAPRHSHGQPSNRKSAASGHYIVQKGDTLWDVAQRFSTTVRQLIAANRLDSSVPLQPGQVLTVARQ